MTERRFCESTLFPLFKSKKDNMSSVWLMRFCLRICILLWELSDMDTKNARMRGVHNPALYIMLCLFQPNSKWLWLRMHKSRTTTCQSMVFIQWTMMVFILMSSSYCLFRYECCVTSLIETRRLHLSATWLVYILDLVLRILRMTRPNYVLRQWPEVIGKNRFIIM